MHRHPLHCPLFVLPLISIATLFVDTKIDWDAYMQQVTLFREAEISSEFIQTKINRESVTT